MSRRGLAFFQLTILTAVHFSVDCLGGMTAGLLPALMDKYSLSVGMASWFISINSISSNALQLWTGKICTHSAKPLLVPVGLGLSFTVIAVSLVPVGHSAFIFLLFILALVGVGSALVHPEALGSICAVDSRSIAPASATSVFMLAGFLGYACGPLAGGALVSGLGLRGLWLLLIPAAVLFFFFLQSKDQSCGCASAPAAETP